MELRHTHVRMAPGRGKNEIMTIFLYELVRYAGAVSLRLTLSARQ